MKHEKDKDKDGRGARYLGEHESRQAQIQGRGGREARYPGVDESR